MAKYAQVKYVGMIRLITLAYLMFSVARGNGEGHIHFCLFTDHQTNRFEMNLIVQNMNT